MEAEILEHLKNIAIPRHRLMNSWGYKVVQVYITKELSKYGEVETFDFKAGEGIKGCNLVLKFPGEDVEKEPILIGAHYDGVPDIEAADDNATAVAALLMLAKHLSSIPNIQRSVWLVAFDLEESGMVGSEELAKSLQAKQQKLLFMISLEMLGYTAETQKYPLPGMELIYGKKGDFISLVANNSMTAETRMIEKIMSQHLTTKTLSVPNLGKNIQGIRLSDHSPFWDYGYNAMMITDTAFFRNPNYHQSSDTIDSLDLPFLVNVTQGLIAVIDHFVK